MEHILGVTVPGEAISVGAYADPIMLAAIGSLLVVFVLMLAAARRTLEARVRRICPERHRPAKLLVALGATALPVDVLRCSLLDGAPVTCSKACLRPEPAGA